MIFIDATKGLSGDTLLSAMIGLLDEADRSRMTKRIGDAAVAHAFEFTISEVQEGDEKGLAINYRQTEPVVHGVSYDECHLMMEHMEQHLGEPSMIGREILELIFRAEGEAHGLPPKEVHLHEIGRPQAILNLTAIGVLASKLQKRTDGGFAASAITTGRGIVVMSHGAVRVPPPVSEILLRGMKHVPGNAPGERATPTGIASVKVLAKSQFDDLPKVWKMRSVGFGMKRFAGELGRTTLVLL